MLNISISVSRKITHLTKSIEGDSIWLRFYVVLIYFVIQTNITKIIIFSLEADSIWQTSVERLHVLFVQKTRNAWRGESTHWPSWVYKQYDIVSCYSQ
jgi:hypothetical protein